MSNREILATTITVTLSLSDWLTLTGWCSAHITSESPQIVINSVSEICQQVSDG